MKKPGMFLVIILLATRLFGAGDVNVSGYFPGAEGETIQLLTYKDLVSRQPDKLATVIIGEDGSFQFQVPLQEGRLLFFRIFNARNYFYANPGESFKVQYEKLTINDYEVDEAMLFRQRFLNVSIQGALPDKDYLNEMTSIMDEMVATYLEDEVAGRVRANHRNSLENFVLQVDSVFNGVADHFLRDYIRYNVAYLQRTLHVRGFHALFHDQIKNQPILYLNPVYMDFFRSLFDNYVFSMSRSIQMNRLEEAVNRDASFTKLMDVLAGDSILKDEVLRELVLLVSVDRMFAMPDFLNHKLLAILEDAEQKSNHPEHRAMAYNIAKKHQQSFHEGAYAANFRLSDKEGNIFELNDYHDSYLYLFFWASWCPLSMQSIDPMEDIARDFKGQLELLGVLVDRKPQNVSNLMEKNNLSFPLVHFDGDYDLLRDFGITTAPFYILIGPGGQIHSHPFVPPHWGADEALEEILDQR